MTDFEATAAITTAPTRDVAERIARALVEKRLAACVQILDPITSYYWWEGKIEEDREVLLLVKTGKECLPDIDRLLDELHPYEVPELVALPISGGRNDYLKWLAEQVSER